MQYCYVKNGLIVDGPRLLPASWENISGLRNLSADKLAAIGWLPVVVENVGDISFQKTTQSFSVQSDKVIKRVEYIAWTDEELAEITKSAWDGVRQDRNQKLTQSDWTQLADSPLTDGDKASWATYRQALRDITKQADPDNIVWPQSPDEGIAVAVV